MSSNPLPPVTAATTPFVQVTTPEIERANRLLALRQHPGFFDLLRISQDIVQTAADTCADYPGWDPQMMIVLKVRMQVAKEHHQLLIQKMQAAIREGVDQRAAQMQGEDFKNAVPDQQGDFVRREVLNRFADMDLTEQRSAGSY